MGIKTTIGTKGVVSETISGNSKLILTDEDGTVINVNKHITASNGGGGGGAASSAPLGETVWVVSATSTGSSYPNGKSYTPLRVGQDDNLDFEFISAVSGVLGINFLYAMSVADSGDVELRLDNVVLSESMDPNTALTTPSTFTFTPGNDANIHTVSSSMNASLEVSASEGASLFFKLNRISGSNDTHLGDFRVLEIRVNKK